MKTAILCLALVLGLAATVEAEIRVGHGMGGRAIARAAYNSGRYGRGYYRQPVHVRGHYRFNGTYVNQHYRTRPDGNFYNNWSTFPNYNPYTGRQGTRYYPPRNYYRRW